MELSNLRERIRKASTQAAAEPEKPAAGLLLREHCEPADTRLYSLSGDALRRMGVACLPFCVEQALFIDTETTGLSGGVGTVAFLVGIGWIRDGVYTVRQYLMKDYASEALLLSSVAEASKGFSYTVSFNGRQFDLPLLETRYALQRKHSPFGDMECVDLLPPARRLWKRRLGSVRLARLEEVILGNGRTDDLPGSEAPKRFFEYLKTGDMALLEEVIAHNRQDILTMGTLLCELCEAYAHPRDLREKADLYSMGLAINRMGEQEEAKELYRMAARPSPAEDIRSLQEGGIRALAHTRLADVLRREGNMQERETVLLRMCARKEGGIWPYVELSKMAEHTTKDYRSAREYARQALALASTEEERSELAHRIARIEGKLKRKKGEQYPCL